MTGAVTLTLASLVLGPVQFEAPIWLWLAPICVALVLWWGRKSLSGLAGWTRWSALALRLVVVLMLAAALAEPQRRRVGEDLAVTAVLDASLSVAPATQTEGARYFGDEASEKERAEDRLGVVTVGKSALVQSLPSRLTKAIEPTHSGALDGTDLAAGIRLALALRPADAAYRIVLRSDGNQTAGDLLRAAEAARAAKVPIDVIPVKYTYAGEVLVDRVVVPGAVRAGENVAVRVVLNATAATSGKLTLLANGEPIDLRGDGQGFSTPLDLQAGPNVFSTVIRAPKAGADRFEAVFESTGATRDTIVENNRAVGVTFVQGRGKVLVVGSAVEESGAFVAALRESGLEVEVVEADAVPAGLAEMNAFDAVVLVNQPARNFSEQQQRVLRQYVHDSGGGLVMTGGPESFGAGGWIGSTLADALPIKMDPPQKRQMPRGALVIVVHSIEIPQGVFYGKKTAEVAIAALSRLDYAGIIEFTSRGVTEWVHPLREVGDGSTLRRAINNLTFGDMPDIGPSFKQAFDGLVAVEAGQRHMIIISDGDPSPPSQQLMSQFRQRRITVSAVCVNPHGPDDEVRMKAYADATGGRFYRVGNNELERLPQIFVKEAETVKRSLIWEGPAFVPTLTGVSEPMRGVGAVPGISGYIVGADREGLSQVVLRGKENDPVLAQWQYGLGKVVTFTSDVSTRWARSWVNWGSFRAFWEQHVRWAARPTGSANLRVSTENRGEQAVIVVEALDASGQALNFAQFRGRLAQPDGTGADVELKQVAPGRYEGTVATPQAGAYVASLRYAAVDENGQKMEGSVQAAITRPFADEFRALQDNAPLLQQVADMTGGRVLTGDATRDALFDRTGLEFPVATEAIWLPLVVLAIAVFLIDVAVRRVRIDPRAIARGLKRLVDRTPQTAGPQLDKLRAARAQAQKKIGPVARGGGEGVGTVSGATPPAQASGVKFEASAEQLRRGGEGIALGARSEPMVDLSAKPKEPKKPAPGAPDEGMSRLLKAKKRAQDEIGDQDPR
ncbi:MAG: hypothetical protein SFY95_10195 [Planctomycetota bacterium]|nr:hypothetical protein [Planctomycetota bacterium]